LARTPPEGAVFPMAPEEQPYFVANLKKLKGFKAKI
jgi:hypothetical protein